ncbi:MAG: RidA family protein [Bryobacteraceae bacterium]
MNENRRKVLKAAAGALVGAGAGAGAAGAQTGSAKPEKKVYHLGPKPTKTPLFSSAVSYGNLLFIAGKGAHYQGDVKAHAKTVLDDIEKELENAGSSMEKVLKVNVYLNDIKDWAAMNEVYQGRWGANPPVRTTVAPAGGIPGGSLVEMDVIAYI